jgi:hypothetical protein
MMEAASTSETSVNFNVTTRRYIPEDTKLRALSWLVGISGVQADGNSQAISSFGKNSVFQVTTDTD